jgi:hypothetical protein
MSERSVFLAALDYDDPAERSAYLDRACAGEPALRAQVVQLLTAHEQSGSFMGCPAPERLAGDLAAGPGADDTRTALAAATGNEGLDFLEPSDNPASLGRLGHYEVREVVGRGGMGVVVRAFDERLHRVIAIKVMASQLATSATARQRFTREARAVAAVTHDHVVTVHAVEEDDRLPYIVMQYVAGASLQARLDRTGPMPLAEVLRIGMQTAAGLAAAHAQGLVHRDVKPANILLENGVERAKLTDFGLARAVDDASLTQSGTVAGTPAFMSPEQAEGKPVDHRSDLFSLGSVLYAMCTGRPPFRAGTVMGVLKRVCEQIPMPIRETNPEVPDWLVAVVEKLHAKEPAARFQSAAEVAELLGRCLAHVQHPSMVPLPTVVRSVDRPPAPTRPGYRKRWAAAAAVLMALFAVLGTTEATGVTNVRATVIRLFTPEGTLVVETDDPAVKVTVEGDGDLVITGAGAQEVRLRAGSYRLRATKDGKPVKLDRDLVAISRGDRQIVRVWLEDDALAVAVPKAERGAFVLLGGKGVAERNFDTLAEAVGSAAGDDTIEVRGNGPFITEPIHVGRTALTIRAGAGFRPVIKPSPAGNQKFRGLLETDARLILEGLEFQRISPEPPKAGDWWVIVYSFKAPLHASNCRFVGTQINDLISSESALCQLRNCEFLCRDTWAVVWDPPPDLRLVITNCLLTGHIVAGHNTADDKKPASIQLTNNTLVAPSLLEFMVASGKWQHALKGDGANKVLRVAAAGNVIVAGSALAVAVVEDVVPASDAEAILAKGVGWKGEGNLFSLSGPFITIWTAEKLLTPTKPLIKLADWKQFWGSAESGSVTGKVRYRGGNLLAKLAAASKAVTPDDFRLRPDSAGYRAGKGGKDLGADVDLVGPGPAYERWKKTPDYQQWLKDTEQLKN